VPQYALVNPHHPYSEQQSPNPEPKQVPFFVPHLASDETGWLNDEAGAEAVALEDGDTPVQDPNADWHCLPQYSLVEPLENKSAYLHAQRRNRLHTTIPTDCNNRPIYCPDICIRSFLRKLRQAKIWK
jgi:hypothetical protein